MAIIKISDLPAATSPVSPSDVVPAVQGGVTKKAAIDQLGYLANGAGATARTIQTKLRETVSVKDFGALGDGVADDTVAIQAAIDSLSSDGGVVHFPPGTYRVARNIGVNDRWGIKVTNSNITLKGDQAYLRRFNTDISTYALAYPILLVGVPDSNVAAQTTNVIIDSLYFIGENTRHSDDGSALTDWRYAIEFKNTSDTWVKDCEFTAIDSSAIWYQQPAAYNYVSNQYYNTTKNYRSKIKGCSFIATAHATPNRALIHAIGVTGIDFCSIVNNYFEWCDDCVSGGATYNRYTDTENDTYTASGGAAALGPLKRTGRNIVIDSNTVYNSSEHCFYMETMDTTINNNNIRTDEPTICTGDQIKVRGRGVTVSGNVISNYIAAISVNEAALDVTITGNVCRSPGTNGGGVIDINSDGIKTFIDNRPFYYINGSPDYQPMRNISIVGNTIVLPDDAVTTVGGRQQKDAAFRIYTDEALASFPEGQIQGITISNNTIKGYNVGIYAINDQFRNCAVTGNTFYGKAFTTAGFSAGTTVNTYAVLVAYQSGAGATTTSLGRMSFSDNNVFGATYLIATDTDSGSAGTYFTPRAMVGNRLDYIKNLKTADVRAFTVLQRFRNNSGTFFLDRTWGGQALENSLSDGGSNDSYLKYCMLFDNTNIRFYTDDAGTYITL